MVKSVLITGANAGLGREVARQLAAHDEIGRVVLACRNGAKAEAARAELASSTGRAIYDVIVLDTTDIASVRTAAKSLTEPVDAVLMNAGGVGGEEPLRLIPEGATSVFASNVLGHAALLDALLTERKLTSAAVYVGSEAARGVPKLMIKRPTFPTSSAEEFTAVIDGTYHRGGKANVMFGYAEVKYLAALWMGACARRHPELRCVTISPGNTTGTEVADEMPLRERILMRHVVPRIGPALGISHSLETGARRLVEGVIDEGYRDGVFYASRGSGVTGPVVDQADGRPEFADRTIQDNAYEAIHRFLG